MAGTAGIERRFSKKWSFSQTFFSSFLKIADSLPARLSVRDSSLTQLMCLLMCDLSHVYNMLLTRRKSTGTQTKVGNGIVFSACLFIVCKLFLIFSDIASTHVVFTLVCSWLEENTSDRYHHQWRLPRLRGMSGNVILDRSVCRIYNWWFGYRWYSYFVRKIQKMSSEIFHKYSLYIVVDTFGGMTCRRALMV